ncbi:MAG TPA: YceI family protein [Terriglobales bacterium]|nr:YceI family protein [Terriglobales bacterium]
MRKLICLTVLLAFPLLTFSAEYSIDPNHSAAQFTVRHLMVSNVKGTFSKVTGTINYDPNNLAASSVEATIDVNTVDTRQPQRDADLRSPNFFDVAKYPTMTFKSTQFYRQGGQLKVKGDLTMHGVTKPVVLDVDGPTPEIKDPWGNQRIGASISTKINRHDWGLNYNKMVEAGAVVGDEITINIDLEAVRKKAEAAAAK